MDTTTNDGAAIRTRTEAEDEAEANARAMRKRLKRARKWAKTFAHILADGFREYETTGEMRNAIARAASIRSGAHIAPAVYARDFDAWLVAHGGATADSLALILLDILDNEKDYFAFPCVAQG